jgi:hypothetical protein
MIVSLPEDSELLKLKEADLLKFIPTFPLMTSSGRGVITRRTRNYYVDYCNINTHEWYQNEQYMARPTGQRRVIASVQKKMSDPAYLLLTRPELLTEAIPEAAYAAVHQKTTLDDLQAAYSLSALDNTLLSAPKTTSYHAVILLAKRNDIDIAAPSRSEWEGCKLRKKALWLLAPNLLHARARENIDPLRRRMGSDRGSGTALVLMGWGERCGR